MKRAFGNYRGMNFTKTVSPGLTIYQGYDGGFRVIYALSQKEFRQKADAFLRGEHTKEQRRTAKVAPTIRRVMGWAQQTKNRRSR